MKTFLPIIETITLGATLLAVVVLTGCATSAPQAKFTQAIPSTALLRTNDEAKISLEATNGVSVFDYEKQRIIQRIQEKLADKKALNAASGEKRQYEVEVILTEYTKGSAFARAMLAGLGQIHITGTVDVYILPEREKVGEFTVRKTFAWGGIYGASTTIEDAELGFAEGVADALTGQKEAPPKNDSSGKRSH